MRHDGSMTTQLPVRQRRIWDLVLTIVLLVLLVIVSAAVALLGFGLAFAGDSCGASSVCDYDRIGTGLLVGIAAPLVIGVIALVATIVALVLRRLSFWIPAAGMLLAVLAEVGAWVWATGGVVPMVG